MSQTGYRTLRVDGASASAVTDQAMAVLRARAELEVRHLGPGRVGVSHTYRPTWALVLSILLLPAGGVGLLFLLVKKTEAGEVVAVDGPTGTVVTVPPIVSHAACDQLDMALRTVGGDHRYEAPPAPVVTPPPGAATAAPPPPPGVTVGDDPIEERTVRVGGNSPTGRAVLWFEAGSVEIATGDRIVLGRDPAIHGDAKPARIPGESGTVSKSHALVAFDGSRVTVRDLHSTNGTRVHDGDKFRVVGATEDVIVPAGARIELGTVTCAITVERPR